MTTHRIAGSHKSACDHSGEDTGDNTKANNLMLLSPPAKSRLGARAQCYADADFTCSAGHQISHHSITARHWPKVTLLDPNAPANTETSRSRDRRIVDSIFKQLDMNTGTSASSASNSCRTAQLGPVMLRSSATCTASVGMYAVIAGSRSKTPAAARCAGHRPAGPDNADHLRSAAHEVQPQRSTNGLSR